jgi:hypothetical protein
MTAAWNHFFTAYHATGRERLDGYDASHFDGLDEAERTRAHAMVLARAEAGEAPEVLCLPLLGTPEARACAERVFARERAPNELRLAAAEAGWTMTGDPAYERAVVAISERGEGVARGLALALLCRMPLTAEGLRHVTARFLTEGDRLSAVQLAKVVLRGHGLSVDDPEDFTRALPLVRQLVGANLAARAESVARLDALIAQHRAGA